VVANDRIERVRVTVGIRGSRNIEIIGGVSRGMAVLSPARVDLADGTKVRIDSSKTTQAPPSAPPEDATPDQDVTASAPSVPAAPTAPTLAPAVTTDPDNAVISAAISAHIDSVVNDARRNVTRYSANR
jgi:hypothetical protein